MPITLRLACAILATWRVAHLVTAEDGPFEFVLRLRARAGSGVLGQAMDCFYCFSVWVAAPIALFVTTDPTEWAVTWLAVSGAACLLDRMTQREDWREDRPRLARLGGTHELLWRTQTGAQPPLRDGAPRSRTSGKHAPAGGNHPPPLSR